MDLHNLNVRLVEYKNILWTCTTAKNPDDIHEQLLSDRIASGISSNCALVMSGSLWDKWCLSHKLKHQIVLCTVKEWIDRGVVGVWQHASELRDNVVVLTDSHVYKNDRTISYMSYAFVHVSQVKYPRQFDAPARHVK